MHPLAALVGALVFLAPPAFAQPLDPPSGLSSLSADGTVGFGHVYNGRSDGMYGFDVGFDVRYRWHAVGLRARTFVPFIFGRTQLWEAGGLYSFTVVGSLSLGAGVTYVSETYTSEETHDLVRVSRIGVPLEVTFRLHDPETFGPYVRGFANLNDERTFGGVSVGITL